MRYLKTYNEAVGVKLKSELKSTVEDLLIELRDEEFVTLVSQIDYHSQKERVKVTVSRGKEFNYRDIKPQIESVWSYLNSEGFKIEHFTCVEGWEDFEEPDDEFTIHQKGKGYYWSTGEDGKIKSIDTEFQKRPSIRIQPIHDPDNFDRIQKWIFDIWFTKDKIVVDRTRGYLTTNEELKPQTYLSAADKLSKMGHVKRPEQLRSWATIVKERETDARKKAVLEEAKKLGQFQLRFTKGSEIKLANCYIQLWHNSDYYTDELLPEWMDFDRHNLWPQFMFGIHPVSEDDVEVVDWYLRGEIKSYTNSMNGIIWLQDVYINLTTQAYKDEENNVKLPLTPSGVVSIESSEFGEVYFANRREAIKFKNLLIALFEGDIDYIQPNNKDFKEDIIETWCENDERPVELSELEDFIDKLRMTNLNKLYRD